MRVIRVFRELDGARYGSLAAIQPIIEIGELDNGVFTRDTTHNSVTTNPNDIVSCFEGTGNSGYNFGPTQVPSARFVAGLATFSNLGFERDITTNPNADVIETATIVFNYTGLQVINSLPFSISNATKVVVKSAVESTLFANRKITVPIVAEVQDADGNPVLLAGVTITLTGTNTTLTGTLSGVTNASGVVTFPDVTPSNGTACNMAASITVASLGLTPFIYNTVILQKEIIKPRRSEVAGLVPIASELATYEMAINITDKKIFVKKADGSVVAVSDLTDMTNANTAYSERISSLTTSGSSGSSTLVTNTLNIPTYTLAGLGGIGLTGLSSTATGLTYTNTTGVFSLTSGYSIPTTTKQTQWDTAYTNRISSLTVTGSSGASTLVSNVLNIPTYTLSGLGGIGLTNLSSTATGLSYTNTTGVFSLTSGYSIPTTTKQGNWDTAYSSYLQWDGGSTSLVAANGRTSLGATTVGSNLFTLTNPSAVTFPRFNLDNTISALDSATFRSAIGAGTSSTTGTVTSVAALTLGTTGTDVSSTVATGTTTPVITLNIPTASALNRGALSSSDFTNFNTAYTNRITSLTTTGSSGAATLTTNALNIPNYTLAGLGGITLSGLSSTATGLTYSNTTGVFSLTSGYSIPTTTEQTEWNTAYSNTLGLVIGTHVQAWDSDLDAIAALAGTTGILKKTAANTWELDTTAYDTGTVTSVDLSVPTGLSISGSPITTSGTLAITLDAGYSIPLTTSQTNWDSAYTQRLQWDGAATNLVAATGRTSLGLVIGTNVQAYDADLQAIAAIAGTAGLLKKTAANTWSLDTSTYITGNQTVTLSGDVSGSGTTAITTTLATVPIAKGGTGQTTANAAINALLPSQTGNTGKYLTSDGSNSSWGTVSSGTSIPSASMQMYAGAITQTVTSGAVTTTAPSGWLLCNGNAVSRTTYSALFTALGGTSSPFGYDATTFNLPDMRGRVGAGVGTGTYANATQRTLGGTIGTENETLLASQIPAHVHPNSVGSTAGGTNQATAGVNGSLAHAHNLNESVGRMALGWSGSGGSYAGGVVGNQPQAGTTLYAANSSSLDHTHNLFINNANNTGGGGSHNNMQPTIGINYIIKI